MIIISFSVLRISIKQKLSLYWLVLRLRLLSVFIQLLRITYVRALHVGLGQPGTMGLILWTIGVGSLQRGVLKQNICMASRHWRERRRVWRWEEKEREDSWHWTHIGVLERTTTQALSINRASRSCISELKRIREAASLQLHTRWSGPDYSPYRTHSPEFCVKIVFTQTYVGLSEHDVTAEGVEASALLTVCCWQSARFSRIRRPGWDNVVVTSFPERWLCGFRVCSTLIRATSEEWWIFSTLFNSEV